MRLFFNFDIKMLKYLSVFSFQLFFSSIVTLSSVKNCSVFLKKNLNSNSSLFHFSKITKRITESW